MEDQVRVEILGFAILNIRSELPFQNGFVYGEKNGGVWRFCIADTGKLAGLVNGNTEKKFFA